MDSCERACLRGFCVSFGYVFFVFDGSFRFVSSFLFLLFMFLDYFSHQRLLFDDDDDDGDDDDELMIDD